MAGNEHPASGEQFAAEESEDGVALALGDPSTVRVRLVVSFAIALMLSVAWAPFCAFCNLLRANPPTIFFSPSRYLFMTTGICVAVCALVVIGAVPFIALAACLWHRCAHRARHFFALMGLVVIGLLVLRQLELLPVSTDLTSAKAIAFELLAITGLVWCVVGMYLRTPAVQVAAFPLLAVYPLLYLVDISNVFVLFLVGVGLIYVFWSHAKSSASGELLIDTVGIALFVAVPFAMLLHVRVGHFVAVLDLPYTLAFIGILGLVTGVLLITRCLIQHRGIGAGVLGVAGSIVVMVAGLCWAGHPPAPPLRDGLSQDRPDIVVIVWDTARAQQFKEYGYHRDTTPVFDKLASEGMLFEHAIASSSWTLPTHASIFTGLWPRTHAANAGGYYKLAQKYDTIAELLSEAGYETIGIVANYYNVGRQVSMSQGFRLFYEPLLSAEYTSIPLRRFQQVFHRYDDGAIAIERGLRRWSIIGRVSNKPFFLFINMLEPHGNHRSPTDLVTLSPGITLREARKWANTSNAKLWIEGPAPPADRDRAWQGIKDMYDGEIRYTDKMTGNILEQVKACVGSNGNVLTIIASDHGESFGEHDTWNHRSSIYDTVLHVPLVLTWPGQIPAGARIAQRISTIDLFATIGEVAQVPEAAYSGRQSSSLCKFWNGGPETSGDEYVVAEVWPQTSLMEQITHTYTNGTPFGRFVAPLLAIYSGDWKYIRGAGQHREILFNIVDDPRESKDLSDAEPDVCAKMSGMLDRWLEETPNNMPTFADGYEKGPLKE